MPTETATVMCSIALSRDVPEWIQLMTLGTLTPDDHRKPWTLSDAEAVVARSRISRDLVVDYEHQTDYVTDNGQPAPAAGWAKELAVRVDGIWARVEWTEKAAAMIRAGEYRFVSPTFNFRKDTREVTRVLRAALTNNPAFELKAVARKEDAMDPEMLLEKTRKALGLKDNASDDEVLDRCSALTTSATALAGVGRALGLKDDADTDAIAAAIERPVAIAAAAIKDLGLGDDADADAVSTAIAAAKPKGATDSDEHVSKADYDDLQKKVATLSSDKAKETATAKVNDAIEAGKIAPSQREWAVDYAARQPVEFDAFIDKQVPILTPGTSGAGAGAPKPGDALTADEKAVCAALGQDPEAFKKTRDADLAAANEEMGL